MTMNKFHLNEFGVVTNPETKSLVSGNFGAVISTGVIEGKWYNGYYLYTGTGGCSSPVSKCGRSFSSQQEAVSDAAQRGIRWFEHEIDWHKKSGKKFNVPQSIFIGLNEMMKPQAVQLTFNFG